MSVNFVWVLYFPKCKLHSSDLHLTLLGAQYNKTFFGCFLWK